jgi:hypothetical protein
MEISLGKLLHVDARTLWRSEAGDFTPWLAENLPSLGEALGLDLQLDQREAAVGDFSCDVLAREVGTNRPVIIENQLERTDHGHLGQLLTYAGGLDAAIIIWISPEVRDEHRKALDWLNRHTDEEVDFFGVVVEAIRIDESKPAVQFRPVAAPNDFGKRVSPTESPSERGLVYQRFFQPLLDALREQHRFTNARVAQPQGWYSFSSGVTGFQYGVTFSAKGLQAELYIDSGNKERNKAIFDWLESQKSAIETELGEALVWERLDNRRASRICAVQSGVTFVDTTERGDELRRWSIDHLLRFKRVLGPRLHDALNATASSGVPEVEAAAEIGNSIL